MIGGEDDQVASASEVDVMNRLSKRRRELDEREGQLNTQANMIAAAEDADVTLRLWRRFKPRRRAAPVAPWANQASASAAAPPKTAPPAAC